MPTATPARRTRARKLPAVARPPVPTRVDRRKALRELDLRIRGRDWRIGPMVEGDPGTGATIDGTATVTIAVRDSTGRLDELLDRDTLLAGAVTCRIAGATYVAERAESDGTGMLTLTVIDEVAWRMRQPTSFLKRARTKTGLFGFAKVLVDEASSGAAAPIDFYCPELRDPQRFTKPSASGARGRGTGADGGYSVDGKPATSEQRRVIDEGLGEAQRLGASRQVMIGVVMAMTNESRCTMILHGDAAREDTIGCLQQGPEWIAPANVTDVAKAVDAFLLGHEANVGGTGHVLGWKQRHGSVKTSRGDLGAEIFAVQIGGSPAQFNRWKKEATETVDRWRGEAGTITVTEPYEYTRGERHGQRENSWDCLARYAEQPVIRRWAQHNTLFLVSDEELRAGAPALEIDGDEAWLLAQPAGAWTPNRPVNEVTVRVLADLWGARIGAVVRLADHYGRGAGVYLVSDTQGAMISPELTVTLRRPAPRRKEPAAETRERTIKGDLAAASHGSMRRACEIIDGQNRGYPNPDVHHGPFKSFTKSTPLDCSESTCYALWLAGLYEGTAAITSGAFGSITVPGPGKEFTLYFNAGHVFTVFADGTSFDTRRIGDSRSGPHMRSRIGPTAGFTVGHIKGH